MPKLSITFSPNVRMSYLSPPPGAHSARIFSLVLYLSNYIKNTFPSLRVNNLQLVVNMSNSQLAVMKTAPSFVILPKCTVLQILVNPGQLLSRCPSRLYEYMWISDRFWRRFLSATSYRAPTKHDVLKRACSFPFCWRCGTRQWSVHHLP